MRESKSETTIHSSTENGAFTMRGEIKPKLVDPKTLADPLQELPAHLHVLPEEPFFPASRFCPSCLEHAS